MTRDVDTLVVGAGLRGLAAALRLRHTETADRILVVDAEPRAGGSVATQRSNGFVCELGLFAFTNDEVEPLLAVLARAPRPVPCTERARRGSLFDGERLHDVDVQPLPVSFASGNEELVQACRRALGSSLLLGRRATSLAPADGGLAVVLGGEVETRVVARRVVLALPTVAAASLLARFDPALGQIAQHVSHEPRAFAFLGGIASEAPELRGYGVVPVDGLETPVLEFVFCTEVFPRRALPDRCLVRAELAGSDVAGDDDAVLTCAERELRRWTGTRAAFGFRKLHRFTTETADGARVECRARIDELAARIPFLSLA